MKAHEPEAYCDIHCYVISTRVIFFESKSKTQCAISSNMENEQNVINTKSLLLTNMPFSGAASTYHSCGDWSDHNQSCCKNSKVKSQNTGLSGTLGLTDNFRLWNSSSLFTFAISFDWYSSESLLQWWSYELLNLLRRPMLFFFPKLSKKVTF